MTMAQQPVLKVSLAVTREDLLSSLSWATVHVDTPVEETEPLKPPPLGGSGKGALQPLQLPVSSGPSFPGHPQPVHILCP